MHQSVQLHEVAAAENALAAGGALIEAKALAGHGGWAAFLASACIPERTAQRYTRLWRSGLNPPQVADLGGVKATDAFLAKWKAPGPGAALFIGADDQEAIAYVWEDEGLKHHYHVLAIFGPGNEEECLATRCPMLWFAEVEGAQPVDTILTFLELNGFPVPMAAWRIETVEKRLAIGLRGLLVDG